MEHRAPSSGSPAARACVAIACVVLACNGGDDGRTTSFGGSLGTLGNTGDQSESGAGTSSTAGTTDGSESGGAGTGSSGLGDASSSGGSADSGTGDTGPAGFNCPPIGPLDCSPGPGTGEGDTCTDPGSCFLGTVQGAVNGVLAAHPEWFDQTDGQPFVLEVEAYMDQVVADVAATGLCAIRDPNAGDEIAVKHDNEYAENFDILTAQGYARYGDGIYTSTCAPAWF